MRKLSWVDKLIFVINSLIAFALLFTNLLPYISPKSFPQLAVLSLIVPVLIVLNLLFVVYWIIKLKKQFILSTLVLFIGFNQINKFYQISNKEIFLNDDLKVMSYNVRKLNLDKSIDASDIDEKIFDFVNKVKPDIVVFQEYYRIKVAPLNFPFKYVSKYIKGKARYAIYSKYKIIDSDVINFENTGNGAIYCDIVVKKDTLRVYNVHLQSLKIQLDKDNFGEKDSEKLRNSLQNTFKKQVAQVAKIVAHEKNCDYKTIICGDFNNTAFSWAYHNIKGDKNDAFVEAGKGFGKSYDYFLPARIDFIFADEQFEINNFKTYGDIEYSDHFPIMARIGINKATN